MRYTQEGHALIEDVAARLREVGYPLVMTNYRAGSLSPDVVGFLPSRSGVLLPHTVVEVKVSQRAHYRDEEVLEQLAGYRQSLGTRSHYLVTGSSWRRADPGLRTLMEKPGPDDVRDRLDNCTLLLDDESVIRAMLDGQLWSLADASRGQEGVTTAVIAKVLEHASDGSLMQQQDQKIAFDRAALWAVILEWLPAVMSRLNHGDLSTPAPVAKLMARLSEGFGGAVLDPFCGTGMLLLRAGSIATEGSILYGRDLNTEVVNVARGLGTLAPNEVEFQCANSLREGIPIADLVISAPPFGLRLSEPFQLSSGDMTYDGDLAAIDACLQALTPGGRMVLLTSRGWLTKSSGRRYRDYLANETHIQALIGLPGGLLRLTRIPTTVVVIDKDAPGETFIADMTSDWESELSSDGAAWKELRTHLEGRHDVG